MKKYIIMSWPMLLGYNIGINGCSFRQTNLMMSDSGSNTDDSGINGTASIVRTEVNSGLRKKIEEITKDPLFISEMLKKLKKYDGETECLEEVLRRFVCNHPLVLKITSAPDLVIGSGEYRTLYRDIISDIMMPIISGFMPNEKILMLIEEVYEKKKDGITANTNKDLTDLVLTVSKMIVQDTYKHFGLKFKVGSISTKLTSTEIARDLVLTRDIIEWIVRKYFSS